LIDERNDVDLELSQVRKQKQEFKSQVQYLEIELNKRSMETSEISHKLDLAQKQVTRRSQQVQEEQQKIDLLNTQITSLQSSLSLEKGQVQDLTKKIQSLEKDLQNSFKQIEDLQKSLSEMSKSKIFTENLTDKKLQDAVTQLSMIILNKEKSYTLSPETRYLVNQIFGENCSKIIEASDSKFQKLSETCKSLRDDHTKLAGITELILQEFTRLFKWVEFQNDLVKNEDFTQLSSNFHSEMPSLSENFNETVQFQHDPELALKLSARLSVKEKEESISSGRPMFGSVNSEEAEKMQRKVKDQKKEIEDLKNSLHDAYLSESQMREEINELKSSLSSLKKNTPKSEMLRFLHCQSLMMEKLLKPEPV
jgi:predicted  nucleic acid-binding Zn-ribbon protein